MAGRNLAQSLMSDADPVQDCDPSPVRKIQGEVNMAAGVFSDSLMSDEYLTKDCKPCSVDGIQTQAEVYCHVCEEYLCHVCEGVHRSSVASRDHDIGPLLGNIPQQVTPEQRQLISTVMSCDRHRDKTVTAVCITHDKIICDVCAMVSHQKCRKEPLKEIVKGENIRYNMDQCIMRNKTILVNAGKIKCRIKEKSDNIKKYSKKCLQEVQNTKDEIVAWAEMLTQRMEDEIKNTEKILIAEMETDMKHIDEISDQSQKNLDSYETLGENIADVGYVLMKKETENTKVFEEMENDIQHQLTKTSVEFKRSEKLSSMMSEISAIGEINIRDESTITMLDIYKLSEETSTLLRKKEEVDVNWEQVTGCTFLPTGVLVICSYFERSLKLFTRDFVLVEEMKYKSQIWDVAALSRQEIIATVPREKELRVINVQGK